MPTIKGALSSYLNAATGSSMNNVIWPNWNNQYLNASTGASAAVWVTWNVVYYQTAITYITAADTSHQVAARVALANASAVATRALKESADARADALLRGMLSAEQRWEYERSRQFEVVVGSTGERRRYRLKHGWAGNVFLLDGKGREVERLCIHPTVEVPVADNLVAQKLLLESNEIEFRRIANRTTLRAA